MLRKIILAAALVLFVVSGIIAADVDVTGKWDLTRKGRNGEQTSEITFAQDGESLVVTMTMRGREVTGEGTIMDNEISWIIAFETPRGNMEISYKGTITDGAKMKGEMVMAGRSGGNNPTWTAKRK